MGKRAGLFERFGVSVASADPRTTRLTEADGDTFDDDAGVGQLGAVRGDIGTRMTFTSTETYDEAGHESLAFPVGAGTGFTKVDGETFDDDSGLEQVGIPAS